LQVNTRLLLLRHYPPSSRSFVQAFDFCFQALRTRDKFSGTECFCFFVLCSEQSNDDEEEQQEESIEQLMLKYGDGLDGGVQETTPEAEDVLATSATLKIL
jgi:hypothetical protein